MFAYIWGITLGRTPLIKLSPKKTVEGFIGAFWSTLIFSVVWGSYFMRFNYMICPVHDLGVSVWSNVQCVPNPVFIAKEWEIWAPLRVFLSQLVRTASKIDFSGLALNMSFAARSSRNSHTLRPISTSSARLCHLCFVGCAIWRFLCFWFQTRIRHQRLWPQHPWTRRHDGSYGLPVC